MIKNVFTLGELEKLNRDIISHSFTRKFNLISNNLKRSTDILNYKSQYFNSVVNKCIYLNIAILNPIGRTYKVDIYFSTNRNFQDKKRMTFSFNDLTIYYLKLLLKNATIKNQSTNIQNSQSQPPLYISILNSKSHFSLTSVCRRHITKSLMAQKILYTIKNIELFYPKITEINSIVVFLNENSLSLDDNLYSKEINSFIMSCINYLERNNRNKDNILKMIKEKLSQHSESQVNNKGKIKVPSLPDYLTITEIKYFKLYLDMYLAILNVNKEFYNKYYTEKRKEIRKYFKKSVRNICFEEQNKLSYKKGNNGLDIYNNEKINKKIIWNIIDQHFQTHLAFESFYASLDNIKKDVGKINI